MARGSGCGCGGGQGLVVGRDGVQVSGSGTGGDPWVASIVKDPVLCEIVEDCAGGVLCPGRGLRYDDAGNCLAVNVSPSPANDVRIGSDGGLWLGSTTNPVDGACGRNIESLPAFVSGALFGTGRNVASTGSRANTWDVVSSGLDMSYMNVKVGCDGSTWAVVDAVPSSTWYTPNYPGKEFRNLTSAQIQGMVSNYGQFEGQAPGYTECGLLTLDQWLDIIQGRSIGLLGAQGQYTYEDQYLVQVLKKRCAQRQVIPVASNTAAIARVWANWVSQGFDMALFASTAGSPAPADLTQYDPARVWVLVPAQASDAVVRGYTQAGFQTLFYNGSRRVVMARAQRLGCRGFISDDGVYTFDEQPVPLRRDPWCYDAIPVGQITHRDDAGAWLGTQGYRFDDSGSTVTLPANRRGTCGWHTSKGSVTSGQTRNAITPGWALPLPDWDSWQMDWYQLFDGFAGTSGGTGVIFGSEDDSSPVLSDGSAISPQATGYSALLMHATYGCQLRRMPSETGTALATSTRNKRPDLNTWFHMRLRVTPTQIQFGEVSDSTGTWISASLVQSTNTTYRGRFMHFYKIQRQTATTTPWGRVDVAWRDWSIQEWSP